MRNTDKQMAYEAGETAGWAGRPYVNPYDSREQEELHLAFIDGYEDGKAQKAEAK